MKRTLFIGGSLLAMLIAAAGHRARARSAAAAASADARGRSALAETVSGVEALDPRLGDRRHRRRAGSHLGRASRRRLARRPTRKGRRSSRGPSMCCFAAPQILEFDAAGKLRRELGSEDRHGLRLAADPSGIAVDAKGNVWVGSGLPTPLRRGRGRGRAGGGAAAPHARRRRRAAAARRGAARSARPTRRC